jgi:VIT1/CCC1 family predicted Fe2+/Mn2+ transporter
MHHETHYIHRANWLRAAVLGANDGIISTSSLLIGVASAAVPKEQMVLTAIAGLAAGALSMAAGEYVSVSSQADLEKSEVEREKRELERNPQHELHELTNIYRERGVEASLAKKVAEQMMKHNALEAHARDELGINKWTIAKPIQAAFSSALCFSMGAALPTLTTWLIPRDQAIPAIAASSLFFLGLLGGISAWAGGAEKKSTAVVRVVFWGAVAMSLTALIGHFMGT